MRTLRLCEKLLRNLKLFLRWLLVFLFISFAVCVPSLAQEKCTLDGTVVDREYGIRLPGTLVFVGKGDVVIVSDSVGEFGIQLDPQDKVDVLVLRPDYHPLRFSLSLPSGKRISLPMELEPRGHELRDLSHSDEKNKQVSDESEILSESPTKSWKGQGVIVGTTIDQSSGEPVSGVSLHVRGTTMYAESDSVGNFAVSIPADTLFTIAVSHDGYEKDWYDVSVEENMRKEVRLLLWQGALSGDAAAMAKEIQQRDPKVLYADEDQIEPMAPLNFKDMLYSLFPELVYAAKNQPTFDRPAYFLYVDGIRWNTKFLNHIDPYTVRAIAVWEGASAPSRFNTSIAVYVVGVTTYQ